MTRGISGRRTAVGGVILAYEGRGVARRQILFAGRCRRPDELGADFGWRASPRSSSRMPSVPEVGAQVMDALRPLRAADRRRGRDHRPVRRNRRPLRASSRAFRLTVRCGLCEMSTCRACSQVVDLSDNRGSARLVLAAGARNLAPHRRRVGLQPEVVLIRATAWSTMSSSVGLL